MQLYVNIKIAIWEKGGTLIIIWLKLPWDWCECSNW